jgi:hypothetical protein
MNVIHHSMLPRRCADGCSLQTVADASLCRAPFEVQVQHLDAGATSAPAIAFQARVVLALLGSGKLVVDGGSQRFAAPSTLLIAADARYQFINDAAATLQLVTVSVPAVVAPGGTP